MPQPRVTGSCLKQGPGRCRRVRGAARRRLGTSSKPQPHICVGTAGASSLLPSLTAPRPADSHSTAGWPRPHAGEATARESLHGTGKGHAHPGPSRVRHVREVPVHCRGGSQSPPQLRPSHVCSIPVPECLCFIASKPPHPSKSFSCPGTFLPPFHQNHLPTPPSPLKYCSLLQCTINKPMVIYP